MAKSEQKIEARRLRLSGRSIKSIAKEVDVSAASVSSWCRDLVLTEDQIQELSKNARDPYYGGRKDRILRQQKDRIEKTEKLFEKGKNNIGRLNTREIMLVGTALYWAEGYKKDNQAGLGSSDPMMMKLYIKWLVDCFGYSVDDLLFRVTVNESHRYRIDKIVGYWSDFLGVDAGRFQKPFYQKVKWKKAYENPENYYGVLRIRPRRSSGLLRTLLGMIEGLKINA